MPLEAFMRVGLRSVSVRGTGRYVPARRVDNSFFDRQFGDGVGAWLEKNVGIRARHWMAEPQTTSDMAVAAARQALERAGVEATAVGLLVVATDTPDQLSPATAARVQAMLGCTRAGVYDLNAACAGWVTALDQAWRTVATDPGVEHALVIGAYAMSRFLDLDDKHTATLFADGAGAVVLSAGEGPGILAGARMADGTFWDALGVYGGGARGIEPAPVRFVRKLPATFNLERWPALVREVCGKAGWAVSEVDRFVFTQLNLRTIEAVMGELDAPMERTHWIMHKWGYTGSACIPMALDDAWEAGKLAPGDRVVLCASGGGIALAAVALEWTVPPPG